MITYLNRVAVRERQDGGISITRFSHDDMNHYGYQDEDAFMSWYMKLRFPGETYTVISDNDIPKRPDGQWDKSQREEWSLKSKKVEVDPAKVAAKQAKESKKSTNLQKLGLTKEELMDLLRG